MVLSPTVTELIQGHSLTQDTGRELLFCPRDSQSPSQSITTLVASVDTM